MRTRILLVAMAALNTGCRHSSPANIKPGMTATEVKAAYGKPAVLSSFAPRANGVVPRAEEVWAYRAGNDTVKLTLVNGVVKQVTLQRDAVTAKANRIDPGMTADEVVRRIGQPKVRTKSTAVESVGAGRPRDVEVWLYDGGNASAKLMRIEFDGGRVIKVDVSQ